MDIGYSFPIKPYVKVYVQEVDPSLSADAIFPEARRDEIERTRNAETRMHKLCAWSLFARALSDIGRDIKDVNAKKTEYGKWVCDGLYFSISHSKDLVCVAISSENVGVDIQSKEKDYGDNFAQRILSSSELDEYYELADDEKIKYIDTSWCKKESIMKALKVKSFFPKEIEVKKHSIYFTSLVHGENLYYLSVCSALAKDAEIICIGKVLS